MRREEKSSLDEKKKYLPDILTAIEWIKSSVGVVPSPTIFETHKNVRIAPSSLGGRPGWGSQ